MKKIVFPMAALAILFTTSCQKDKSTTPAATTTPPASAMNAKISKSPFPSVALSCDSREVDAQYNCFGSGGPCAPEETIITVRQQNQLYRATQGGAAAIKELFSNEATALIYAPDWNKPYFADVKKAILSGEYTFVKAGTGTYLLGKEGVVSTENFDYAIPYKF